MMRGKRENSVYLKLKNVDENDFARTLFRRLKTQESILSNEYSVSSLTVNDVGMKKFVEKLNSERNKTWDTFRESNLTLRDELDLAVHKVSTLQKINNLDVEDYREEVEHIQKKIAFNRNTFCQKLNNLKNTADLVHSEVSAFQLNCEKL